MKIYLSLLQKLSIAFAVCCIVHPLLAQDHQNTEKEIITCTLGYIENFFENNTEEMFRYLHPQLAKRGISRMRGTNELKFEDMTIERLAQMLQKKKAMSKSAQQNKVKILDIFHNTASVRLETGYPDKMKWIEYIHLVKTADKWLIANIVWDYYPRKRKMEKK